MREIAIFLNDVLQLRGTLKSNQSLRYDNMKSEKETASNHVVQTKLTSSPPLNKL